MVVIGDMGERDIKMKRTLEKLKVKRNTIVCDRFNKCKDWEKSYRRLSDSIEFFDKCFGGPYTGVPFRYCPYCGNILDGLHHSVFYDRRTGDNKDSSL